MTRFLDDPKYKARVLEAFLWYVVNQDIEYFYKEIGGSKEDLQAVIAEVKKAAEPILSAALDKIQQDKFRPDRSYTAKFKKGDKVRLTEAFFLNKSNTEFFKTASRDKVYEVNGVDGHAFRRLFYDLVMPKNWAVAQNTGLDSIMIHHTLPVWESEIEAA